MMNVLELRGKTALITGGEGGLGHVIAREFAGAGATVFTTVRRGDPAAGPPPEATAIGADVTDERGVASLFDDIGRRGSAVDILVATVGGYTPPSKFGDTPLAVLEGMLRLNLASTFLCAREFLRRRLQAAGPGKVPGYGRIFTTAAFTGLRPVREQAAYAASKAAVIAMTASLGEELKGSGIRAIAIAPRILATKANMDSMPDADRSKWVKPESVARLLIHLSGADACVANGTCIPLDE
jgi:NAD(P)-dependent dehydrogenase (short-subunit alcohol dehydrogenase family)